MPYTDSGSLIIKTYTAGGALPVGNSVVKITGVDEDNRFVEFSLLSDVDGLTPRIPLPSPQKSTSLSPDPTEAPYAQYNIAVSAEGYYPKLIKSVAVFSGVDTFLPINMIPIAIYENGVEFPKNTLDTTVIENPFL